MRENAATYLVKSYALHSRRVKAVRRNLRVVTRNETRKRLPVAALRKRRYHEHGSKMLVARLRRIRPAFI
jgi:hypothetical protein